MNIELGGGRLTVTCSNWVVMLEDSGMFSKNWLDGSSFCDNGASNVMYPRPAEKQDIQGLISRRILLYLTFKAKSFLTDSIGMDMSPPPQNRYPYLQFITIIWLLTSHTMLNRVSQQTNFLRVCEYLWRCLQGIMITKDFFQNEFISLSWTCNEVNIYLVESCHINIQSFPFFQKEKG